MGLEEPAVMVLIFIVNARDEVAAKIMLGKLDARTAIMGLLAVCRAAFATQSRVQWERQGVRLDVSEIRLVIGTLVPVTRALGSD